MLSHACMRVDQLSWAGPRSVADTFINAAPTLHANAMHITMKGTEVQTLSVPGSRS